MLSWMSNPWAYIHRILGPGPLWGRTHGEMLLAIERARQDGEKDAQGHLEIMARRRASVLLDVSLPPVERPVVNLRAHPR